MMSCMEGGCRKDKPQKTEPYEKELCRGRCIKESCGEGRGGKEEGEEEEAPKELELESYTPGAPAIKVSLGVRQKSAYQINGVVGRKEQVDADDLDAGAAWGFFGVRDANDRELYL